ncbi:heavy-metal-associated domain-containing protein [Microvirga sp. CF3062]|uniref:heavy-metal-associated domain-containing protein n=1 Tax=Microvirga sp. CF3062 TaxID=3110182 RepID=UPI002E75CC77|nr:heavy-metal-associated domain-containing protein [Microvirga sp. CF3062]MEE1657843.1 heavy-metal-associated domain-containing protein [Microvirga sp. CF3062]
MFVFNIPGMNCGGCIRAITRSILALDPQAQVEADLETWTIRVASTKSETSLLDALSHGGYPAQPLAHSNL